MKALGRRRVRRFKSQSAMEYLMTYGWAILIIAVVLGALYSLGIFNSTNFAPKAPPGSCQVFRPNGPGTTFDLNLMGVCNGELPEYVASMSSANLAGNYVNPIVGNQFTINVWITGPNSVTEPSGKIFELAQGECDEAGIYIWGYYDDEGTSNTGAFNLPGSLPSSGSWFMITIVGNSGTVTSYINGVQTGNPISASTTISYSNVLSIGGWYFCSGYSGTYIGEMSNEQVYNTSLSASEIQALYQEGIGGAPIDLQNLVAWWPLNGNANDYSGNNYNLYPTNGIVSYISNWYSGYTPP